MIRVLGTVFAALLGLAFGSFLNVCLSRWPVAESIVTPRSHCRNCGRGLKWWENVPLLSWIALRGRCRGCGSWIGWRYVIVEAAVGGLWGVAGWRFFGRLLDPYESSHSVYLYLAAMAGSALFYWLLVALAVLDAEYLWLPDWVTWPGILLGTLYSLLPHNVIDRLPLLGIGQESVLELALRSVIGSVVAALLILIVRWTYWILRRREGIGMGDAKLMALLAAWLGLPGALLAFAVGVLLGAAVGLVILVMPRENLTGESPEEPRGLLKLPLGTFLCIGGIVSNLWGHPMIAAYLRWAGL